MDTIDKLYYINLSRRADRNENFLTECNKENIPIDKEENGKPEIHYTNIFNAFKFWVKLGYFDKIFEASVSKLFAAKLLDISVLHGDGICITAKKGVII